VDKTGCIHSEFTGLAQSLSFISLGHGRLGDRNGGWLAKKPAPIRKPSTEVSPNTLATDLAESTTVYT